MNETFPVPSDEIAKAYCPNPDCRRVAFESVADLKPGSVITIRKKCDKCGTWWWLRLQGVAVAVATGA